MRKFYWLLALILLFSIGSKLIRLPHPQDFYFDEVYHGFTAKEYLHGNKEAFDPWAKPPKDRAYEWTHPPAAKTLMAGFMGVFGENSFGWRIGSVLFGTAAIGTAAIIAIELFGSAFIALATAFLLSIEGLFFAQSRIAMNDSYFSFFMLVGVLCYIRWVKTNRLALLVWTGAALGMAVATKWTAFYVFAILGLDIFVRWVRKGYVPSLKDLGQLIACLGLLPAAIYVANYFQYFLMGYDWENYVMLQKQMWWYHTGLKATHGYQSKPWQWIFNLRPVWMHVTYFSETKVGNIYNIGNSVILIPGFLVALWSLIVERGKTWTVGIVLLCYFGLWVPWVASPRIMLFYHYMPALPFLAMLLARWLEPYWYAADKRRWVWVYFGVCVAWFLLFYPNQTAWPLPKGFVDAVYHLLPGWR